jgi:hypothetical protein
MIIPSKFKPILDRFRAEMPVNLGGLASALGLEVYRSVLPPGISGLIEPSPTSESGYRIKLNRFEPVERQRFTLAHEISHFLLHRFDIGSGVLDDTMYRSSLSDRKEVEANKLASQIIMPLESVKTAAIQLGNIEKTEKIESLARQFKVSKQAMQIRLGI